MYKLNLLGVWYHSLVLQAKKYSSGVSVCFFNKFVYLVSIFFSEGEEYNFILNIPSQLNILI